MPTVIPANVALAAKRGFVRTTSQAYATSLSAGLPGAAAIISFVQDTSPGKWLAVWITLGLALVSPLAAGLASYLSITSKGIPEAYLPELGTVEAVDTSASEG